MPLTVHFTSLIVSVKELMSTRIQMNIGILKVIEGLVKVRSRLILDHNEWIFIDSPATKAMRLIS